MPLRTLSEFNYYLLWTVHCFVHLTQRNISCNVCNLTYILSCLTIISIGFYKIIDIFVLCKHCNNREACNLPIQRAKKGLRLMIDICVQRMGGLLITPLKSSFLFVLSFFTGFLCLSFFARETFLRYFGRHVE